MKYIDKSTQAFPVKFNLDNPFICGTTDTLKTVAMRELAKLTAEGKTVYITDPYLFKTNNDQAYASDLQDILLSLKANRIIYCARMIHDPALFHSVETALASQGCTLTHNSLLTDCHDRFWLCPESNSAVIFGTSLNGLCKKICRVDTLSEEEVSELKKVLTGAGYTV